MEKQNVLQIVTTLRSLQRHLGRPFIDTVLVNIEKFQETIWIPTFFDEYLVQVEHDFAGLCKQVPRVISSNFLRLENGGAFHMVT